MQVVDREKAVQFIKYCLVGVLNTLLTLGVIYVCTSFFGMNLLVSNVIGYICGVTNSFLCNKQWVFQSKGGFRGEGVRFLIGFGICYLLQFWVVWMLSSSTLGTLLFKFGPIVISGDGIATILGNVVYTLAFFIYNRVVTFR